MPLALILSVSLAVLCVVLLCRLCCQRRLMTTGQRIIEQIFLNVAAYVLLIDDDFNVLETNYYIATGTTRKAMPPKVGNLLHCKNGEDAGECGTHDLCAQCPVRAAIAGAFRAKEKFSGLEAAMVLYTTADRSQSVACDVSVSGHYMDIDSHPHMVLTISDITAQKQTQRELTKARIRAEESDRMKSLFLANTSHELRTPLNAIVGFSDLLVTDLSPEEKQEYIQIIRSNSDVLMQLVNDILDLSKIEAGTLEYEYAETELNTVMEELEGGFRMRQPQDSPVRIAFHRLYPACTVTTDRKRLSQVVVNFLSNAVKFTTQGSIDFGYEIRGREVYFYVTDTGSGISEERQKYLFKRFVKIGSHKQGVGIGLAISKSIVESMGGRIGAESKEGEGSTFWFTLPYKDVE